MKKNIELMINELITVNHLELDIPNDQEKLLKTLMTISRPVKLSDAYVYAEKAYLRNKEVVLLDDITEKLMKNIFIYKGDITTIKADVIVNAANETLLGCFIPGHHCIDNAIHLKAGLGLRNECHQLMRRQGHNEAVGKVKITSGHNLPSKYIAHTVGPNVMNSLTKVEIKIQLSNCYLSILKEIDQYEDIRNIIFCSISTGVYCVPIKEASEVALKTISTYLDKANHHLDKVIIDVFSQEDYDAYKQNAKYISES